jgi:hypothetical protein
MKNINQYPGVLLLTLMLSSSGLMAADFWHDGQHERRLYQDSRLVAQLVYPSNSTSSTTRQVNAAATTDERPQVRLLRAQERSTRRPNQTQEVEVAVYRDSPRGPVRVATGGVLLRLQPELSRQEQADWLEQAGLQSLPASQALAGYWLISSPPGDASIELANRLQAEEVVVSASPNWWRPRNKR